MLDVFALVRRIAPHFRSVLVSGPTGTGNELVARALHQMSPVRAKPFVVCNCAAIVETLFESELFGHVRGSLPARPKIGRGTSNRLTAAHFFWTKSVKSRSKCRPNFSAHCKSGEFQRVGSSAMRRVSVRAIAATNGDLRAMVRAQEFREDLFFRLSMLEIQLPPLSDRREDLPLLCRHFIDHFARQTDKEVCGLTQRAQMALSRYSWPGNIRELENIIGHACMMTEKDLIDVGDLPEYVRSRNDPNRGPDPEHRVSLFHAAEAD